MSDNNGSDSTRERLQRALRQKAILAERSKLLQQQVEDFRSRETSMNHIAAELLQRQRELNYMLHRASSVLHQMQDTNLALSAEFTHLVKELPAPKESGEGTVSDWDETISRVNDLFRRTHELAGDMQDEIFRSTSDSPMPDPGGDIPAVTVGTGPISEPPVVDPPKVELQPDTAATVPEPIILEVVPDPDPAPEPRIIEAGLIEPPRIECAREPEPVAEPVPEPRIASAVIIEQPVDTEPIEEISEPEPMEDIFRRLNAAESDSLQWRDDGSAAEPPRKPSLLARIFGVADDE